jgi:aryl-alcohol dehydrogenase-like predicted oxidoreductase
MALRRVKLGLGTVQFGRAYGVSNNAGRVPAGQAEKIIVRALTAGVRYFDTAAAYGEAEAIVGARVAAEHGVRVVTKLSPIGSPDRREIRSKVRAEFARSLQALRARCLYGLLLHRPADLFSPNGTEVFATLAQLRSDGLVERIGVSVYEADEIEAVLSRFPIDIVQLPASVFDQRLVRLLGTLRARGIEVHVRSIFLQGLMLMEPANLPVGLRDFTDHLAQFRAELQKAGVTPVAAAVAFARQLEVDCVVVGVTGLHELDELLAAWSAPFPDNFAFSRFAFTNERLLNPSHWPATA